MHPGSLASYLSRSPECANEENVPGVFSAGLKHQLTRVAEAALYCAHRTIDMLPPSLLVSLQGWGLIDLPLRASNEGLLRPRVARAQKIISLHPLLCSASKKGTWPLQPPACADHQPGSRLSPLVLLFFGGSSCRLSSSFCY